MRHTHFGRGKNIVDDPQTIDHDRPGRLSATAVLTKNGESMKLIPWEDIWTSLRVARIRGNGEMIDVFYDTPFKEAIFDDDGAWAFDQKKRF